MQVPPENKTEAVEHLTAFVETVIAPLEHKIFEQKGRIFDLDQIKRASELEIGAKSVDDIELIPLNDESHQDVSDIMKIFENE